MRDLLRENLVYTRVECACLERSLASIAPGRDRITPVALLAIDAEGWDTAVLDEYPFAKVPT